MTTVFAQTVFQHITAGGSVCALSFKPDGTITGSIGSDLLGFTPDAGEFRDDGTMSRPNNLFDECDVFVGMENDIGELVDTEGGELLIPSVVIDASDDGSALDIRISRHEGSEFLLVATRADMNEPFHFQRLRKARSNAYETELVSLERARFETVYRNNPVISFAVDQTRMVLGWSNEALDFAANGDSDAIDRWIDGFLATQRGEDDAGLNMINRSHEITSAVRGDGSIRIVDLSTHSLENEVAGRREHYFVLRDITDQETAFRNLVRHRVEHEKLTHDLKASNDRLQSFARIAAHDLVAPIGRMQIFSELLKGKLAGSIENADAEHYLDAIIRSARTSATVVHDILQLSHLDTLEIEIEPCDLHDMIRDAANDYIDDNDHALSDSLSFGTHPVSISADQRYLRSILRNLLGNAWKYRDPARPLTVRVNLTTDGNGKAALSIEDNGLGFETQTKRNVFDPFVRMANTVGIEGSGLGLSMVRTSVDAMGWTVDISSQPGRGTTVRIDGITLQSGSAIIPQDSAKTA